MLTDGLECCGLLWCFYQLFGLSFWRHPFTSIAETLMQWHITLHVFNQKKKNSTFCTWWSAVITICNISFCFLSQSKFIGQKRWFFRGICFGNIKINTKRHLQPIITWHVHKRNWIFDDKHVVIRWWKGLYMIVVGNKGFDYSTWAKTLEDLEKNIIRWTITKKNMLFWWTYSVQSQWISVCLNLIETFLKHFHISWHNGHRARIENLSKFTNVLTVCILWKIWSDESQHRWLPPRVEFVFVLNQSF